MFIRSRREFLRATVKSAAALGAGSVLAKFGEMNALAASSNGYQALVCIYLQGCLLYTSPNSAVLRANLVTGLFGAFSNPVQSGGSGTSLDLTPYLYLASNPTQLANALDLMLTHGTMPAAMKSILVKAITEESGGNLRRVQKGAYLILTSSYYNVWH